MTDGPLVKYEPRDFLVRESMVAECVDDPDAGQHYLLLRKAGYTTMEAIRVIADQAGLDTRQLTYGGLKDEDGITEQLIAVPSGTFSVKDAESGWRYAESADRWMQVLHYGFGREPLHIGELEGNGFQVLVRNLDAAAAARVAGLRKVQLFFLNYYDTQRFGVPGGPKRTHLVGRSILSGQWDEAVAHLIELRAPESALAQRWHGSAQEFFTELDPRTTAFYLAAAASYEWNARVREAVAETCPGSWFDVRVDGLDYRYLRGGGDAARLLATVPQLPGEKYTFVDGVPVSRPTTRAAVVQTAVEVGAARLDDRMPGRFAVPLRFFLPSGSYATAAIRQLLAHLGLGAG